MAMQELQNMLLELRGPVWSLYNTVNKSCRRKPQEDYGSKTFLHMF